MTIEAMKQALEALESCDWNDGYMGENQYFDDDKVDSAITSLRQAIEQAEKQEPVGWIDSKGNMICVKINESYKPLYTYPQPKRTWVGLTDEEFESIAKRKPSWALFDFYRLIEAKLKEKNT